MRQSTPRFQQPASYAPGCRRWQLKSAPGNLRARRHPRGPSGQGKLWRAVVALTVCALLSVSCNLPILSRSEPDLPIPLADLIPQDWRLLDAKRGKLDLQPVNLDDDPEIEWLLYYHYDNVPGGANGPIGGIIYDAQQDSAQYDPQVTVPFPYQPSVFLVPYRLLPDSRMNKGQGYLGDTNVAWEPTYKDPAAVSDEVEIPKADELVVRGYDGGSVTRLTLAWWQGPTTGYGVVHFQGSHSVMVADTSPAALVQKVEARDHMNDRSYLCKKTVFTREATGAPAFVVSPPTLEFCQGTPSDPTYPEAVVVAWLLGRNAALIDPNQVAAVQGLVPDPPARIISVTYSSTQEPTGLGRNALSQIEVYTTIEDALGRRDLVWHLTELKPTDVGETSVWRIDGVTQEP